MGGPCALHIHADDTALARTAAAAAQAEVCRLEAKYSRYRDDSVLSRINASAGGAIRVDAETAALLDYAAQAHAHSEGLFDISSGILRQAWDFRSARVPDAETLAALCARVGWGRVGWDGSDLRLPADMELDFGGFAKEYAADRAAQALRDHGIAHGLVDLGGDLALVGPHPDGRAWQAGIRHPRAPEAAIAQIELDAGGLASSGDYERFMIAGGRRYCHILDPRNGWPAQGLAAVSVLAPQCLVAGTAATVAMLMGPDEGPAWLADSGLPYLCVDARLQVTGSIARS